MKKFCKVARCCCRISLSGLIPFTMTLMWFSSAAALEPCDVGRIHHAKKEFQEARKSRTVSRQDLRQKAQTYLAASQACMATATATSLREPANIDEGGLWMPSFEPDSRGFGEFVTRGTKWGGGSPYTPQGPDVAGPGTPGGTVTYSWMTDGLDQSAEGSDANVAIESLPGYLPCFTEKIEEAFIVWSAVADIEFVEVADSGLAFDAAGAAADIRIGAHTFDGAGNVLAHAYFPPPNGVTAAGDMHFDREENWTCDPGSGFDIGIVAMHELGHAVGLEHQPVAGDIAIMNPSYNASVTNLQLDDVEGAVSVYGAAVTGPLRELFIDNFENGFANWTADGLWNLETESDTCGSQQAPFSSSDTAAYYGQDGVCNYDTPGVQNTGSLTLNSEVEIPARGLAFAAFSDFAVTEGFPGFDFRAFELSRNNGTSWNEISIEQNENEWGSKRLSLSDYLGQSVLIRFRFDTVDGSNNAFFGWLVDDVSIVTTASRVRYDMDADGKADLLWRHADGENLVWFMDGKNKSPQGLPGVINSDWIVQAIADTDGDGRADIIWRNESDGRNQIWQMLDDDKQAGAIAGVSDLDWQVVGADDFDGNGTDDLLWRNSADGRNSIFFMDGFNVTSTNISGVSNFDWTVVGTGDLNGDGKADILWRNSTTGANVVWQMDGTNHVDDSLTTIANLAWEVQGIGDVNSDGQDDVIWRNATTQAIDVWLMGTDLNITQRNIAGGSDSNFVIERVGDIGGDGNADIIWRHQTTGSSVVWEMDGAALTPGFVQTTGDTAWGIVP